MSAVYEKAREFVDVPFRHCCQERAGVDCVGLCLAVARELGILSYRPAPYSRQVDPVRLRCELERFCRPVSLESMEPGDILLLRVDGLATHVGIYGGERMIHAYEPAGKVVETTWSDYWVRRIEAVYRLRER